jgi:hypothetical protein
MTAEKKTNTKRAATRRPSVAAKLNDRGARAIERFFNQEDLPDFLTNAVMVALDAASEITGIPYWKGEDFDMKGLAALLAATRGVEFEEKVMLEPANDLAEHIAAVLTDPDTPTEIYDALAKAVTDIAAKDKVTSRPEVIRVALRLHAESKEGGE